MIFKFTIKKENVVGEIDIKAKSKTHAKRIMKMRGLKRVQNIVIK